MISAFLFDFNATLIHSPSWMALEIHGLPKDAFALLAQQGHIESLSANQIELAESTFNKARKSANDTCLESTHLENLQEMVAILGLQNQISQGLIEETVASLHKACVSSTTLIDGVTGTLRELHAQGYRLGIISNAAYSPFLHWTLEHFKLLHYFEQIIVSANVGIRKPNPKVFILTLEMMNLQPAESVYIGDDFEKDVIGAKQAGLRSIWFSPSENPTESESDEVTFAVAKEFSDILEFRKRWETD